LSENNQNIEESSDAKLSDILDIPIFRISDESTINDRIVEETDPFIIDLSTDIKDKGLIQPIVVYKDGENYKIVVGKNRLKGSYLAGLKTIKARVLLNPNPKNISEIVYSENKKRKDFNLIDETTTIFKCLACYVNNTNLDYIKKTHQEILEDGENFYKKAISINIKQSTNASALTSDDYQIISTFKKFVEENNISISTLKRRAKILKYDEKIKKLLKKDLNAANASDLHNLMQEDLKEFEKIIAKIKENLEEQTEKGIFEKVDNDFVKKIMPKKTQNKVTHNKSIINQSTKVNKELYKVLSFTSTQLDEDEEKVKLQEELKKMVIENNQKYQEIIKRIGKPKRDTKSRKKK